MPRKSRLLFCSLCALVAGTQSVCAQSQTGAPDASRQAGPDQGLGDIVVTVQRRSESLQRVPIAITAVTSEALEARGITDILSLRESVPSLNVSINAGFVNP